MTRATLVIALLLAPTVLAWDSVCEVAGAEGELAARHRWVDPTGTEDEHRQIWLQTMAMAGVDAGYDQLFTLTSYTADAGTLQPANFLTAGAVASRAHSPSEFAQLPDFSYSLWDWSLGNETCPLPGLFVTGALCHSFLGHMGATNSNHFAPQTRTNYLHYHSLAMGRAADCAGLKLKLAGRPELARFHEACVQEALVLEAIAHHYLQDNWSMGHMWERWGSPDEADFNNLVQAGATASFSGLIHGGRAVLQPAGSTTVDVNDAMCAPAPDVNYSSVAGLTPAVGDLYYSQLIDPSGPYVAQFHDMLNCTTGGLRAVLLAAGESLPAPSSTVTPVDPSTTTSCFSQRATNLAFEKGYAVNARVSGLQLTVPLDVAGAGLTVLSGTLVDALVQFDALQVGAIVHTRATDAPQATDVASGGTGTFFGVAPNSAHDKLGAYADPPLPWSGLAGGVHGETLARQFHEAHAKDWCGVFAQGEPEFDLEKLRDRVATLAAADAGVDVACSICAEFVERHLRIGDPATYNPATSAEPLCGLIADTPSLVQYVYEPTARAGTLSRAQLAQSYCGCDPLEASAGTFFNQASGATGTALLVRLREVGGGLPVADVPLQVQGPPGWNGNAPLALTYPRGAQRQFYAPAITPVSGDYVVSAVLGGRSVLAGNTVDATVVLAAPTGVTADVTVPGQVGSTWTAAAGATSYLTRVFDITQGRILSPTRFTTSTTAVLSGLSVNAADQNALQVWAFSNDMTPPDPSVPAQFNASFNRVVLSGSVVVAPSGATVGAGATVGLTATVTGLGSTQVSWSGAAAGAGNTAIFTAPNVAGTYVVTATSVANPAFRGVATFHVTGGGVCDVNLTAQKFTGHWTVTSAAPIATLGAPNCTRVPAFAAFLQGGTIDVSGSGGTGTATPQGLVGFQGAFNCAGGDTFGGNDFAFALGTALDPTDPTAMNGILTLQLAGSSFVPCSVVFDAVK